MSWARLDDRYPRHPKVQAAGPMGMCLDVAGICYAADHATDGFVPDVALPTLLAFASKRQHETAAAKLVDVGRWRRDDKVRGYWIHDYLKYNPSSAERKQAAELTESRRAADRERKRRERNTHNTRNSPPSVRGTSGRTVHGASKDVRTTPVPKDGTAQRAGSPVRPVPPDTPPPTVGAAADDDVPDTPVPRLSAQLRAEAAAKTLADHGIANGQPPPPATRPDVDPADFEAERRRQLAALKASESETP